MDNKIAKELIKKLKKLKVAKVESFWGGYGDSGSFDYITFKDNKGEDISMPVGIESDTEKFLLDQVIPDGLENNDGGQGNIVIDVTNSKIDASDLCENYTESEPVGEVFEV